jgi:hypothetical protein
MGVDQAIGRAEHISIEAEQESPPTGHRGPRRVRAALDWHDRLRGIRAQLEVHEDHHAHIRHLRPRTSAREYSVDLRFVNAKPLRERSIAWITLLAVVLFGALAVVLLSFADRLPALSLTGRITAAIASATAALALLGIFIHRTTESLIFSSVHGETAVIRVTGGLGSARRAKAFFIELMKSINQARAQAPDTLQAYLSDEMREHHRLRSCGAITEAEYERSKARILAAHATH